MKKIITCLAVSLCSLGAFAQYYSNTYNPAGSNPGGLNQDEENPFGATNGYTILIAADAANAPGAQWSGDQSMPFAFDFDGSAVTDFKVSNTGVLTFTTSATSVPLTANESLPSALIPDKSVVVWGISQGAGNDQVLTKVHGTAPNRQLWVNYASFSSPTATGQQWTYWGIVLEETTNNIYVVDLRTLTTPLALTIGVQIDANTAIQIASAPNTPSFVTNGGSAIDPSDNVYYEFISGTRPTNDIANVSFELDNIYTQNTTVTITGEARNNGSAAITSFDLNWTADGGTTNNSATITANIAAGASYTYTHPDTWTPGIGESTVEVTVDQPNGVADELASNNTKSASTFVNTGVSGRKRVLLEEFTTAPCQFCPDGAVVVEEILAAYPGEVIAVGEHACFGTDAMTIQPALDYCAAFSSGAPTATVDRTLFDTETAVGHSRGQWQGNTVTRLGLGTPVSVDMSGSYDSTTRAVNVDFVANFVDVVPSGDIRVTLFVVEDNVTGIGSGYDQVNFYNTQAGHQYTGAGNPVIGFNHRHVLRQTVTATWGDDSVIPSSPTRGTQYTQNYSFNLDNDWDDNEIKLVAFVHYYDAADVAGNEIMNAIEVTLDESFVGLNEANTTDFGLKLYPNPTSTFTNVAFKLESASNVEITLRDITGKVVMNNTYGTLNSGDHFLELNVNEFSNGFYFATITVGDKAITRKISVNK